MTVIGVVLSSVAGAALLGIIFVTRQAIIRRRRRHPSMLPWFWKGSAPPVQFPSDDERTVLTGPPPVSPKASGNHKR